MCNPEGKDMVCGICRWQVPDSTHTNLGQCRKGPPGKYDHPEKVACHPGSELHPIVEKTHWCSEFIYPLDDKGHAYIPDEEGQ